MIESVDWLFQVTAETPRVSAANAMKATRRMCTARSSTAAEVVVRPALTRLRAAAV